MEPPAERKRRVSARETLRRERQRASETLRRERLRRNWSLTRVSALTLIAAPDLSALERGILPAYPGWRRKLADVFGMTEQELFEDAS